MALINCPECSKEISDSAKACPHCGYPLIETEKEEDKSTPISENENNQIAENKQPKINKKVITAVSIGVLATLVFCIIYYFAQIRPQNEYNEAIKMLESGKYSEAETLLNKIPQYEGVDKLKEQMKYESRVFACITDMKKYLKNPDSLQIYDVKFYLNKNNQATGQTTENNPVCIISYGAQNGFGGNTTGYALFSSKDYSYLGNCNTLDINKISSNDYDEKLVCIMINSYKINTSVGDVDLSRIKTLLKNDSYSAVKIIQ